MTLKDMLGRSGRLDEAENFIKSMHILPNITTWTALLGACRIHDDIARAERVAERALELNPTEAPVYADKEKVYDFMIRHKINRTVGVTTFEINGESKVFAAHDNSYGNDLLLRAKKMVDEIRKVGYIPDVKWVLHPSDNRDTQEEELCYHSEKLAISFKSDIS